jgi:hypothetical protein
VPPVVYEVLRAPGAPLDASDRTFFESRFGRDFSRVRVHTDARAAESARAVAALAYAVGEHIVFGADQYHPETAAGRELLAHELAHTLQQRGGGADLPDHLEVAPAEDAAEREADAAAAAVSLGSTFTTLLHRPAALAREGDSAACVCGPNITSPLLNTIRLVKWVFEESWTDEEKETACESLTAADSRLKAWDIRELHSQQWVERYRPDCANCSTGPTPCGLFPGDPEFQGAPQASVQVNNGCYYMGSVNYVIFGVMCRLCHEHYRTLAHFFTGSFSPKQWILFDMSGMADMVWAYKGDVPFQHFAAANYVASDRWATAGYVGWGEYGSPAATPASDRPCATSCPHAYPALHLLRDGEMAGDMGTTSIFQVTWGSRIIKW